MFINTKRAFREMKVMELANKVLASCWLLFLAVFAGAIIFSMIGLL